MRSARKTCDERESQDAEIRQDVKRLDHLSRGTLAAPESYTWMRSDGFDRRTRRGACQPVLGS